MFALPSNGTPLMVRAVASLVAAAAVAVLSSLLLPRLVICACSLPRATSSVSVAVTTAEVAVDRPVSTVARTVVAKSTQALSPRQN
ncbi:hypothetical protein D3C77_720730 [compost metagenome]